MVDITSLEFTIIIIQSLASFLFFHVCLQEMRNFPSLVSTTGITTGKNVHVANYVRIFTIFVSGLNLSYCLMMFGHVIGLRGLDTLRESNIGLAFVVFGFITYASFTVSQIIDRRIYKSVAIFYELVEMNLKDVKNEIREKGLIKSYATSEVSELERELDRMKEQLAALTKENFELARSQESLEEELNLKEKSVENAVALTSQSKKEIETTEVEIKANVALLNLLTEENEQLDKKLENIKQEHSVIEEILNRLINVSNLKRKDLEIRRKEFQNCSESVAQSKKVLEEMTSKLDHLKKKSEEAREEESDLAENHEKVSRDLTSKYKQVEFLLGEIDKYQLIVDEYNVAELSVGKEKEALEILKKRTEEHFNQEQKDDDKIFINR